MLRDAIAIRRWFFASLDSGPTYEWRPPKSSAHSELFVPLLVVDGREISWREFGRMLTTYEGWNFKLDIFDSNEEG